MDKKPIYMSKTLRGIILLLVGLLQPVFGIDMGIEELVPLFDQIATVAGTILAIYGRIVATQPLTLKKKG